MMSVVGSGMVGMVLVLLEVDPILGKDIGFKNKIVLHSFREVKYHQVYTPGICYYIYGVLGLPLITY